MTVLYDHYELQEISTSKLNFWKAWHLILYFSATAFGVLTYVFLENAMQLVDSNCILYPHKLELSYVANKKLESSISNFRQDAKYIIENVSEITEVSMKIDEPENSESVEANTENSGSEIEASKDEMFIDEETTLVKSNGSHHAVLDMRRSLMGRTTTCQFAQFVPLLGSLVAVLWAAFFIMCPSGGYSRSGLQEPWRIVPPALVTAAVLAALTGYSFALTDGGLNAFCASFLNATNATSCSSVVYYVAGCEGTGCWWQAKAAVAARVASAGAGASWVFVTALLLARCLIAPDFRLVRTQVCLEHPRKRKHSSKQSPPQSGQKPDIIFLNTNEHETQDLAPTEAVEVADIVATSATIEDKRSGKDLDCVTVV